MLFITNILDKEYHQLCLFYFVSFLFGILLYFSFEHEPSLRTISLGFASSLSLLYLSRFGNILRFFAILTIFFVGGILAGTVRTYLIHPITIPYNLKTEVTGQIESIKPKTSGVQILLSDLKIEKLSKESTPIKIRANVRTKLNNARIGDYVKLKASLGPPPKAALPGSYDFSRSAFFARIGAVGYSLSDIEIVEFKTHNSFQSFILELRRNIYKKIIPAIGSEHGNFAAAIMLGETSALDKNIIQSMRAGGISHILAVSGLHLSLVAMLTFVIFRFLFNAVPYVAHYMDVKQISAIFALIGSFFYLLISGMQVAAIRAFIMTSIVILAIICKRTPSPMRSVTFAAFLILLAYPEYALHPSFHLSFVAVISLIAGYELYIAKFASRGSSNLLYNLKLYLFSNIYSTISASLATAPFVIYHFYIHSNYSVLANLIAVPITSFIVMPSAIFAFFFMLIGLEYLPLKIMDFGIHYIIKAAEYIESIPYSVWYFGHISGMSLFIYGFGFLWLCFWKTSLRFFGLIPIMISLVLMLNTKKPDLIIGGREYGIAKNQHNILVIEDSVGGFMQDYWTSWFGQKNVVTIMPEYRNYDLNIKGKVIGIRHFDSECIDEDLIINLSSKYLKCPNTQVISKKNLKNNGTHVIFIDKENGIEIKNQSSRRFQ